MRIEENSVIKPLPSEELIEREEKVWRVMLPKSYKLFIRENNGAIPYKKMIKYNERGYIVDRFLCILEKTEENDFGAYDIDVILTQIEERLTDNEDLVGVELLPIVKLVSGDYICLDFKNNEKEPLVCLWNHEESGELEPVTYLMADNFSIFIEMFY